MNMLEYYMMINDEYHEELDKIMDILQISFVDDEIEKQQKAAAERLEKLVELSK